MATDQGDPTDRVAAAPVARHDLPNGTTRPEGMLAQLFAEAHRFDFFQAVRLLETHFAEAPAPGETVELARDKIRFRPHEGLAFPAGDLRRIEGAPGDHARLSLTFMGLYGVASPLPAALYEDTVFDTLEAQVQRDFLDIFNHRLYALFYRAWKKYRPSLHFERTTENPHARTFLCLAGLGTDGAAEAAGVPALRLAAVAGLLGTQVRNAAGLRALLIHFLGAIPVRIVENLPCWVTLPDRPPLGRGARLGLDVLVGRRVYDESGTFRIMLGVLTLAQYRALLPGGELAGLVLRLARLYVPDHLDFDVELLLDAAEAPALRLGDGVSLLGRHAWLGRPRTAVVSEVVRYE